MWHLLVPLLQPVRQPRGEQLLQLPHSLLRLCLSLCREATSHTSVWMR